MRTCQILLVAMLLVGCKQGPAEEETPESAPTSVATAKAGIRDMRDLLPIDGQFVFAEGESAKLAPAAAGKMAKILVHEGDQVQANQLLAVIDKRVLDAGSKGAAYAASSAESVAAQSRTALEASKSEYEASVRAAKLSLETVQIEAKSEVAQAQAELDKLHAGARPQEIAHAEQTVRQAKIARDKANAEFERDKRLIAEGYVSGQQYDADKAALETAESALTEAKATLSLVKEGPRKEEIRAAEVRLATAKTVGSKRVDLARSSYEAALKTKLVIEAKAHELSANELNASQKRADALAASELAKNGEIRAPFAGIVVKRNLNEGDSADPTTVVLEIARKGARIDFVGSVSAEEASKLIRGMPVLAPDEDTPSGTIRSVGTADMQSGLVPIRVSFPMSNGKAGAGAFRTVRAITRTYPHAVAVPVTALVSKENKTIVFVVESGVAKMRDIEAGPTDGGFVAVKKGLKANDVVVVSGQQELSDGAKVEATPSGKKEKE